jgi:hypothetical protein
MRRESFAGAASAVRATHFLCAVLMFEDPAAPSGGSR